MKRALILCALLLQACMAWAGALVVGEPGNFVFTDKGYFADKPVTVYYYKARSAGPDARVMVVIHGAERQGSRMRDNWVPFAEKNRLIVLAPEFDEARFSSRLFNMGGIESRDRSQWSFQLVEHLFDFARADEGLSTPDYLLFGHSAGGQFVHRFMLLAEAPRVSVAVAANAGSYTMPVYPGLMDDKFPYALDERIVSPDKLKQVFARKLVVLLGEADTQTDAANLPRARQAAVQGANRFERGSRFFAQAQAQAQKLGTPLAWERVTVPGVGHDSRRMSQAAARLLFEPAK
jgi:poly(3-hydroxybutyrate) depolymerase